MSKISYRFGSDNHAGIHPEIIKAIITANQEPVQAYGEDEYTSQVGVMFKKIFGEHSDAFIVFNGTGANVIGLKAMLKPWQAIICAETAHINSY